jgi:small subunit ribosomal protein S16
MVVIRLARGGAKKSPFYQIVAADKRRARDSRFIEKLGYFNPIARGKATRMSVDQARVDYWLSQGAQPSDRVAHLLKDIQKNGATAALAKSGTRSEQRNVQSETARANHAKAKKESETATPTEEAATDSAE